LEGETRSFNAASLCANGGSARMVAPAVGRKKMGIGHPG